MENKIIVRRDENFSFSTTKEISDKIEKTRKEVTIKNGAKWSPKDAEILHNIMVVIFADYDPESLANKILNNRKIWK